MRRIATLAVLGILTAGITSCAKKVTEDVYVSDPNLQAGLFAELKGDYKKAEEVFRSSPDKYWGGLLLSDLYFYRLRDYDRALKEVERVEKTVGKKSPKAENVLYRKGLILQAMGRYPEAGKVFEYVAVNFPEGRYFEDATEAVEEMFRRNFPETLGVYDGGYVSSMMLEWVLEQIPPFQRGKFDNPEGRKQLVERIAIEEVALREAEAMRLDTTREVKEKMEAERKAALRQAYYMYGVKAKARATEKELKAYYNAHKSNYRDPARLEIVRVGVKDSATAYKILKAVRKGAKLDSIAADTTVNIFKPEARRKGKLVIYDTYEAYKDLFKEAFKHDTGDVFVYRGDTVWMVIKVLDKKPERYKTFDEVKNIVKNAVEGEKERKIYQEDRERLKRFYGVKIFIEAEDTTVKEGAEGEREEGMKAGEIEKLLKELPDTVAVIEKLGKVITDKDLVNRIRKLPGRYQSLYATPAGAKKYLENAILPEILEVAEAELRRYYLHYPIYSRMRQAYKDAMLLALYNKLVKEKVNVSDEEVRKYYETHKKDEFTKEARVRVQRIVVKDSKTAYQLLRKIRSGKVKADSVARAMTDIQAERSRAGYVFITKSQEPDFFRRAWRSPLKRWRVMRMKDGRWAVYRVLEKQKTTTQPFEEVKGRIRQKLQYEKEKELYEKALEYLKKKYHVKVYEDRIEKMYRESKEGKKKEKGGKEEKK